MAALDQLDTVLAGVQQAFPDVGVYVDLTELRGFRYHTVWSLLYLRVAAQRSPKAVVTTMLVRSLAVTARHGFAIDLKALVDDASGVRPPTCR